MGVWVMHEMNRVYCQEWILGALKSKSIEFEVVSNVN